MNRHVKILCALFAAVALSAPVSAAPEPGEKPLPEQRPVNEFLPFSYLQFVPYKHLENIEPGNHYEAHAVFPYYFEGSIAPNLILFENHTQALLDSTDRSAYRTGGDVTITPRIDLRLYRTPSLPVRHPSFRPQITGNFTLYFPETMRGEIRRVHKVNFQAKVEHYSNGSDECLFQEDTAAVEFENGEWRRICRENDGHTINNLDGEFTSTFVAFGIFHHYSWLDHHGVEDRAIRSRIQVDFQPAWLRLPGAAVPTQRRIYNPDLKITASTALYTGTFPALGGFKYFGRTEVSWFPMIDRANRAGTAPYVTPYGLELQLGWLPDNRKFLRGWSFYVGTYHGQDLYNIEFRHRVTQVSIGFSSTSSLQFRMR